MAMDSQPIFDFEKEFDRARWYRSDLDTGTGWTKRCDKPGEFILWSKTFPDSEFPIVCLYEFRNMPMPYEKCADVIASNDMETRKDWDKVFEGLTCPAVYPDGAFTYYIARKMPWPISDRDWILHRAPFKKIEWFGKSALMLATQDISSTSTFVPPKKCVRASNGGNFTVVMPGDENPETTSRCFGSSSNTFNGWLPSSGIEWLVAKGSAGSFYEFRQSIISGYNKYFKE